MQDHLVADGTQDKRRKAQPPPSPALPMHSMHRLAPMLIAHLERRQMKAADSAAADPKAVLRENEKKWGKALMSAGWTCIPSTIILRQQALGLDPIDMNILLVIAAHWWKAAQLPFPSKKLIADTVGVDTSTVRRRLARLEAHGLIKRIHRPQPGERHQSNIYSFAGLVSSAEPYALEEIAAKDAARAARIAKAKRKGLRLVPKA